MTRTPSKGFTLIELVIVIVVVAILAVIAAPKLIDLADDAEMATFESLGSALIAAANMAHYKQRAAGLQPNDSIEVNGVQIAMINGYPTDAAIGLLVDTDGFTYQPSTGWFVWIPSGNNLCRHDYNYAGWSGNPTPDKPYVVITRSGCQ
ncbi:prepilin-type N-terminal cleavage/methylation domain-containing protein [Ferrimonas kyonanensis]|uniref:prepilin-type N-terminal cleavage/methylation domain-containing protein n=1 Tax=Ferrimonas kyonanensis TaxID=364763 RepID=UPI000426C531|nr:prepilin-type N-terminal cleavage/methylation domain-containing protein [Ferrimonas kyonanensis]